MSIVLRSVKGSELTFAEVDGNFESLFYSSSISGNDLNLHFYGGTSQSINLNLIPALSASYAATASFVQNAQSASYVLNAISSSFASTIASGLNITASNILVTGTASIVFSQIITSSTAFTSGSNLLGANSGDKQTLWGTIDLKSGPLIISGSTTALGSITAPSFTGSLQGTSSWANNAITASYILNAVSSSYAATASYVQNAITASFALNSPASTFSSSSLSASFASSSISASYASSSTSASYALSSTSASYSQNALSASNALTASYVLNAVSSSFSTFAQNTFLASTASYTLYTSLADAAIYAQTALYATSSLSASFASSSISASYSTNALSASYASSSTSASYATNALSASFVNTASYVLNALSSSQSVSSSYAITSSYSTYAENANTANSATTAGSATIASAATSATSASYALTASYVENVVSSSFAQSAVTASFALSVIGGTFPFTGSAIISGSLRNIGNTILSGSTTIQSSSLTVNTGSLFVNLPYDGVDNTTNAVIIDRGNDLQPALSVTGSSNFDGALNVNLGTLTAKDNLIVSGSSTFTNGGVTVKSGITITGPTLITGSTSITGSTIIVGNTTITGSLRVSGSITGSLLGTASFSQNAISASNISGAISNNTNDYILTATGDGSINGESGLTFDGTILKNNASNAVIKISDTVNSTTPTSGITSFVEYNNLPNGLGNYYGETISGIAGENLSYGQIIVLNAAAHDWVRASAEASNSLAFNLLGICLDNASDNDPITILLQGFVVTDKITISSYSPGQRLWLSNLTGTMRDTAPGTPNRIIGHMYQDVGGGYYNIKFNPDNFHT
jgi:hypothetical protein